jgi:hypothetical protein
LRGSWLILRRSSGSLRQVFLQQGLENKEDDKRQKKDEEKPTLSAGFLLRIFEVGQSFIKYLGATVRSLAKELYRSPEALRHPKSIPRCKLQLNFFHHSFPQLVCFTTGS